MSTAAGVGPGCCHGRRGSGWRVWRRDDHRGWGKIGSHAVGEGKWYRKWYGMTDKARGVGRRRRGRRSSGSGDNSSCGGVNVSIGWNIGVWMWKG